MINSYDEWSPLKRIVVGSATDANWPVMDPVFAKESEKTTWKETPVPRGPVPQRIIDEANEDLDTLANTLIGLGVEVVPWQCEPDGHFAHPPEPTGDNLASLGPIVRNARVDLAFVLDPDADRLALLDAEGQFPSEEYTLALAADGLLARRPGPLVINLSTSRLSEWVAKARGCPCIRTPVGEAHVVDGMLAHQAVLGGEGNGGVMDSRVGWVRDPFVGMALILGGLALSGNTLRQAISSFPKLTIIKDKTPLVRKNLPAWMDALKNKWPGWLKDERDGLRLECDAGWIQVRASNTEPIARIIAESANIDNAPAWIREAVALMPPG